MVWASNQIPKPAHSPDTFQVALPGGDVQRCVPMGVDWAEGAAGVQHQLSDVHAACVRRPVETHVQLLRRQETKVAPSNHFMHIVWKW